MQRTALQAGETAKQKTKTKLKRKRESLTSRIDRSFPENKIFESRISAPSPDDTRCSRALPRLRNGAVVFMGPAQQPAGCRILYKDQFWPIAKSVRNDPFVL